MSEELQEHFVARGIRSVNGKSSTVWLSWTTEGGGWYQWSSTFDNAMPFKSESSALAAAKECPGPWFNEPAANTVSAIPVDYAPPRPAIMRLREAAEERAPG